MSKYIVPKYKVGDTLKNKSYEIYRKVIAIEQDEYVVTHKNDTTKFDINYINKQYELLTPRMKLELL